jgi:hypoxanthine phosphoribosyltransferase
MSVNKLYYSWDNLDSDLRAICRDMAQQAYKPDVVIGPGRGAYIPGVMLSHYFGVPFEGFTWQTRDGEKIEDSESLSKILSKYNSNENILCMDDINDTGKTLIGIETIAKQYESNIRYATLMDKLSSDFGGVSFTAREIPNDDEHWIVFPYEEWWK